MHRDLKPANVMVTKSGAKLLDFGLAKLQPQASIQINSSMPTRSDVTAAGTIVGTLQYMAPEQLEGADADGRTDVLPPGNVTPNRHYDVSPDGKRFLLVNRPVVTNESPITVVVNWTLSVKKPD